MTSSILAAQTDFSIGESILTTENLIKDAVAAGATTVAVTDVMNVTAMIDFSNQAKKAKIKPIIGCRIRLVDDHTWRKPPKIKSKLPAEWFLTYYVLSETGMTALFKLLSLGNDEAHFYFTPKVSITDLVETISGLTKDDVAIATGSAHSAILHPNAANILSAISSFITPQNIFLTLTPVNIPYYDSVNAKVIEYAQCTEYPLIATRPAYYPKGQHEAAEIMTAISKNEDMASMWHCSPYFADAHAIGFKDFVVEILASACRLRDQRGVVHAGRFYKEAMNNTQLLVDKAKYVWAKQKPSLPVMAPDEFKRLVELCQEGWKERFSQPTFGHQPTIEEQKTIYHPRLKYELNVLKTLGFSGYFLLVHEVVHYAKTNNILVGPGRGSVGGSLVAYLMGITDCDPLRFGLLFERFINPDRIDLPDADLDFMSLRRDEVVDYLIAKYGQSKVAMISNFNALASSSAIRDVCRVFNVPEHEYRCSKLVPKKFGNSEKLLVAAESVGEIGEFSRKFPELWTNMLALEGTTRNMAVHAAGVVVSGCDLTDRAVVFNKEGEKNSKGEPTRNNIVCWDKRTVEDQGLIKMDLLGLLTLDHISLTLEYIAKRHRKKVNLLRIPLDDKKVLDHFAVANTAGVFQFESGGMRRLLKELGADGIITFDDITAATALYRPGPMESGMMDSFYLRKQGLEAVEYDHPLLEEVLKPTYGVFVYQEQVMKASIVIAGYTGPEADTLRKIMGKKLPEEMAKQRDKFVNGCVKTVGCDVDWAGMLFDKIEGFAGYGFNKSHSVEYTLISYECMWLKTYFPIEFFASALSLMKEDKLPGLMKDAKRMGISVDMPDVNLSSNQFEIVTDNRMVIPFNRIKGIGQKTADAIVEARKTGLFKDRADFEKRARSRNCNIGHIGKLNQVGAFARIDGDPITSNHPSRIKDQILLVPGLVDATVPINRDMNMDKDTKIQIVLNMRDYQSKHGPHGDGDGWPAKVTMGAKARFMVITDAPTSGEEADGMSYGRSFGAVQEALADNGLARADAYWTALIKRPKIGKEIMPDEITKYAPYLQRELELLKPTIIVLLGSKVVRTFLPDFQGKASEGAGQIIYSKELDANIVTGFSPGEIYHNPDKQTDLNNVFYKVTELLK